MRILGIDPGLDGGLALLRDDGSAMTCVMTAVGEGRRELDLARVAYHLVMWTPQHVIIEAQQSMPKQGVASSFRIGLNYGQLVGLVRGLGLALTVVRPQQWQKVMLAGAPKTGGTKAAAAVVASRLWPGIDWRASSRCKGPHDGMVDAALIAEYGRRMMEGLE